MSSSPHRAGARAILAGGLLAPALIVSASPASAHDRLVESHPQEGERFDDSVESIDLRFNTKTQTLGASIFIVDEEGTRVPVGDIEQDGPTISVPLSKDLPEGGYSARWRVVSSDGHPISGAIPFAVGDAEPLRGVPEHKDDREGTDQQAATPTDQDSRNDESGSPVRLALVGILGAVGAVSLLALTGRLRSRRP